MKQPDLFRDLAANDLNSLARDDKTTFKVANPSDTINFSERPSIIPGVNYPLTKKEEHLLDLAWEHAVKLSKKGLL